MIVRSVTSGNRCRLTMHDCQTLLAPGNTYRTRVVIRDRKVTLIQRNGLAAFWIGLFGLLFSFATLMVGLPVLVIAGMFALWVKRITLGLDVREWELRSGLRPFVRTRSGSFEDIDDVTIREVLISRNSQSTHSSASWRSWDVTIHGLSGKLDFPVWEQGDEEQAMAIAQLLSRTFDCRLKQIHPKGVIVRTSE